MGWVTKQFLNPKRKRSSDPGDEMQKRLCLESVSFAEDGFSRFEEKLKVLFEDGFNKLLCKQHQGVRTPNLWNLMRLMRRTSRLLKMVEPRRRLPRMPLLGRMLQPRRRMPLPRRTASEPFQTPQLKDEVSGEEEEEAASEEKVADNSTEKAATPKKKKAPARVSNNPSPKSSSRKKNQPAEPTRILQNRRQNPKYKQ
ncbi:unnamed protein product [Microthlaspi erraticum]|uniref:Uncharacterized protein n=1 Tax=Microthlaspi erraticum TaxID=1685480 RepID=A0A6D2IT51_9BRAS|nr:unnamed protein product [Microthlaspi erraticum]